jgi:hypothetical protein
VFFLIWLAVLAVAAVTLMPGRPLLFALALAGMTLILVLACHIKGEPFSSPTER